MESDVPISELSSWGSSTERRPSLTDIENQKLVSKMAVLELHKINQLKKDHEAELVNHIQRIAFNDFNDWRESVKEKVKEFWLGIPDPNKEKLLSSYSLQLMVICVSDEIPEITSPYKIDIYNILRKFHQGRDKACLMEEVKRIFKQKKYRNLADTKIRLSGLMSRCLNTK